MKLLYEHGSCKNIPAVIKHASIRYTHGDDLAQYIQTISFDGLDERMKKYINITLSYAYLHATLIANRNNQKKSFNPLFEKYIVGMGESPVQPSWWMNIVGSNFFYGLNWTLFIVGIMATVLAACSLCIPVVGAVLIGVGISLGLMMIVGVTMTAVTLAGFGSRALTLNRWDEDNANSQRELQNILAP